MSGFFPAVSPRFSDWRFPVVRHGSVLTDAALWFEIESFLVGLWPGVHVESSAWSCHLLEQWCVGTAFAFRSLGHPAFADDLILLADVLRALRFKLEADALGLDDDDCWSDLWVMSASAERRADYLMSCQ